MHNLLFSARNSRKVILLMVMACCLAFQTQADIFDWLQYQYTYWMSAEDNSQEGIPKQNVPDTQNALLAANLLVDVSLDNPTPTATDEFCYRIRYRCASVTEHCYGAYVDMTLPLGVELAKEPRVGGNVRSVATSGISTTGIYLRVDLATNKLAYLEAGSAGAFKVCGNWPCEDDGIGQTPAAATTVNFVNSVEFHENSSTQIATDPADITVPSFTICPPPAVTTSEFVKEDNELGSELAQPNGVFRYKIKPKTTTNQVEYIDSIPDALEIYDFRVDRSSWGGWTIACDCGSGFVDVFNSTGVSGLSAKLNWVSAQDSDPSFPNLMGADGITDTGCDAVFDDDLGYYIISGLQKIRWITDAAGFSGSSSDYATVTAKIKDDTPIGNTIQNCAVGYDLTASTTLGASCLDITIRNEPLVKIRKFRQTDFGTTTVTSGIPAGYYKQEDDIQWELRVTYDNTNGKEHEGFSVIDTLPKGFTFIEDSGDPPNWYLPSYNYPSGLPTNLVPANQEGCRNPIFTKSTLGDGRTVLKWDFPTCLLVGGRDDTEISIKVFFTTRYDRCVVLPINVTNTAYADFGEPVYDLDEGTYSANGEVSHYLNFDLGSSNTFDAAGSVTSEKWVQGALDTDFSRYPSFGATNLDGDGVYELFIWNLTEEMLTTIDVVDILPHIADSALVGTGARDSEWSAELASAIAVELLDIPSNTWTTVPAADLPLGILYGTSYNSCYLDGADSSVDHVRADPSTANFPTGCTYMSNSNPAIGAHAFAFRWENMTTPLQFGQGLKITVYVQQLNGESDAPTGAIAWNSFAYTATQQTSGELLSTEPIKVGLRMVDECTSVTTGDRIWNDTNGNGIQDDGEQGIEGVTVHLYQSDGDTVFVAPGIPFETQTNSEGMYYLPGLPDGDYIIRLDNFVDALTSAPLDDLMLTLQDATTDTFDSDAALGNNAGTDATLYPEILVSHTAQCEAETANDFGFIKPATLSTYVWEDSDGDGEQTSGEPAVENVTVELLDASNAVVQTATTNNLGFVAFADIFPGTYKLRYTTLPAGYVFTGQNLSGDAATDSDANSLGETETFIVIACDLITYMDAGITLPPTDPATIEGVVWDELGTKNGLQEANEPLLEGITVQLLDAGGFLLDATTTNAGGDYQFTNLTPNIGYQIQVIPPDTALVFTIAGTDMDVDATGISTTLTPTTSETIANIDIGLCGLFSIGNLVWFDTNNDGQWNNNEGIFPNVNVYLIDGADGTTYLDTTTTDANGKYLFTDLVAADYIVEVDIPTGGYLSSSDIGTTPIPNSLDSDDNGNGNASAGRVQSDVITLQNTGGTAGDANWTESDHGEPINGILDRTSNPKAYYTVDFGFREQPPPCNLSISNISTANCTGTGPFTTDINVDVTYINAPSEDIHITLDGGNLQTIVAGATSPQTITFAGVPADGTTGHEIIATFATTTTCVDTASVDYPAPCPATITTTCYNNVATTVVATSSSAGGATPAAEGNDGISTSSRAFLSLNEVGPWWELDFGTPITISSIVIDEHFNFTDSAAVHLLDASNNVVFADTIYTAAAVTTINAGGVSAEKVHVKGIAQTAQNLGIRELYVNVGYSCIPSFSTLCNEGGTDEIVGSVWKDYNYDGIMDNLEEEGVQGTVVNVYDNANTNVFTTATDANGNYKATGLNASTTYRVEFTLPTALAGFEPTQAGGSSGTTVQFVSTGNCANLGMASPSDFCTSSPDGPLLVLPCFVARENNGIFKDSAAIVSFNAYRSGRGDDVGYLKPTVIATHEQVGAVYGNAYNMQERAWFFSAYFKRGAGFGPSGPGAIYKITESGTISTWVDINSLFSGNPAGDDEHTFSGDPTTVDYELNVRQYVGKISWGDIDLSLSGDTLFAVNMYNKYLYLIPTNTTPTASNVDSIALPQPTDCVADDTRPFGLGLDEAGNLYVAFVCSNEYGSPDGIEAYAYRWDGGNAFTKVLQFDLSFDRGSIGSGNWEDWGIATGTLIRDDGPMFTDIEFDGMDMVLGFRDHQGDISYRPGTHVYGDIYRACFNGTDWDIEDGGTCGGVQGVFLGSLATPNAAGGPGGGHFYDNRYNFSGYLSQGGLVVFNGNQAIDVVIDPYRATSAGIFQYKPTGEQVNSYEVYYTPSGNAGETTYGKINGLGDVEAACAFAPNEIGNYVWEDTNQDGIQGAGEPGIQGINVALFDAAGTLVASTVTNADGEYYFSHSSNTAQTWINATDSVLANTTYWVVVGNGQFTAGELTADGEIYFLTTDSADVTVNGYLRDSNGEVITSSPANAFDNLVATEVATGAYGIVDHSIDFGFIPIRDCELIITSLTSSNCMGTDPYIADLQVELAFVGAPVEDIHITLDGSNLQTIVAAAASPQTVTFTGIPADGTAGHEIIATFATTTTCADTSSVKYPVPCPPSLGSNTGAICSSVAANSIAGTVFEDWNYDGLMNQSDTIGVAGVQVDIYDTSNNLVGTTYTDSDGNYQFAGLSGTDYRVEFLLSDAVACWATATHAGENNGTTVQFVASGECANLGVASPADYCQENPYWVTSCYIYGDQTGTEDVLVSGPYNLWESSQAVGAANQHEGLANQIGTVLGMAYHRSSRTLLAAAFQKRHSGYASGSTGTIYQIPEPFDNLTGNGDGGIAPSVFLDLNTLLGSNVAGDNPHPTGSTIFFEDYDAYDSAGKIAFGDIDLSEDGSTLWAVNLKDRSLYKIPLGNDPLNPTPPSSASEIDVFPLYNLYDGDRDGRLDDANDVDLRPFGLAVHRGMVYVGVVNSAESSITLSDPDGDENLLEGLVFSFDPVSTTFELVLEFPLNYARGCGTRSVPGCIGQGEWRVWSPIFPRAYLSWDYNNITGHPQPLLADIAFAEDGTMLLGLRDRFGDQMGGGAGTLAPPPPTGTDSSYYKGNAVGDILRARKIGDAQWSVSYVESTDGTEFFAGDAYVGTTGNIIHAETSMGGLSSLKGQAQVAYTVLDPEGPQSAGLDWVQYETSSTAPDGTYTIYQDYISTTFFGKANGLGELELTCDPAPIEIGNYVWEDTNGNGIQDAGESGIQGVNVELYDALGTLTATTTTNDKGEYYFSHSDSTSQSWSNATDSVQANTAYYVVIGNGQFTGGELTAGADTYTLTTDSTDASANGYLRDSDGEVVTSSPANAFDNLVATQVTTGDYGFVDHSIDFGFLPRCTPPLILHPIPTPVSTLGGTDGSINLTVYNGVTAYNYTWDNGTTTGSGTGTQISGLSAGVYQLTLTDADGCMDINFSEVLEVDCIPRKVIIERSKRP